MYYCLNLSRFFFSAAVLKNCNAGFARSFVRIGFSNKTRSPTVAKTADRSGCRWFSRSSKINGFHIIWKPILPFSISDQ